VGGGNRRSRGNERTRNAELNGERIMKPREGEGEDGGGSRCSCREKGVGRRCKVRRGRGREQG